MRAVVRDNSLEFRFNPSDVLYLGAALGLSGLLVAFAGWSLGLAIVGVAVLATAVVEGIQYLR